MAHCYLFDELSIRSYFFQITYFINTRAHGFIALMNLTFVDLYKRASTHALIPHKEPIPVSNTDQ